MNKIKSSISYINKKLAKTRSGLAAFLILSMNIWYMQNNNLGDELSDTLSQEKVVNVIDRPKIVKSENFSSLKNPNYVSDFDKYTMPKLEYNDYENGTKNDAFEYLWFAGNANPDGSVKKTKILEYLKNTDNASDLVTKLCAKSFSDDVDWHQDAKKLDLVRGMLESGNDKYAKSIANCLWMRQFSMWAAQDYGIAKKNHKWKITSDLRTNPTANISASHRYLKDNYAATKDLWLSYRWYHCGLNNISNIKYIYKTQIWQALSGIWDLYYADDLPDDLARKIVSLKDNSFDYFAKINTAKYIYNQRKTNPNYIYEKIEIASKIKFFKQKWSMAEYMRYPIENTTKSDSTMDNLSKYLTWGVVKIDVASDSLLDQRLLYVLNFLQKKSSSDIYMLSDFANLANRDYFDNLWIHVNAILVWKWIKIPVAKISNYPVFKFWLCQMRIWWWISRCEEQMPNGQRLINISINPNVNLIPKTKVSDV